MDEFVFAFERARNKGFWPLGLWKEVGAALISQNP